MSTITLRSLLFEGTELMRENTPLKPTQAKWVKKVISLLTADGSAVEDDVFVVGASGAGGGHAKPQQAQAKYTGGGAGGGGGGGGGGKKRKATEMELGQMTMIVEETADGKITKQGLKQLMAAFGQFKEDSDEEEVDSDEDSDD